MSNERENEWVLVPRTVTAEMEAVYANDTGAYPDAQSLHDAMLAAAPSPPADAATPPADKRDGDAQDADCYRWLRDVAKPAEVAKWVDRRRTALAADRVATTAMLTNPHTGQPRDYRDVESDPDGILCVPPGPLLAAKAAHPAPDPLPPELEGTLSPMAEMAEALRRKAEIERERYEDRRQSGEWGPAPDAGTQADFCPSCDGSGWDGESRTNVCPTCNGGREPVPGDEIDRMVEKAWGRFESAKAALDSLQSVDIDDIGNKHSDEEGNIPQDAWEDFAIDLLRAVSANREPGPAVGEAVAWLIDWPDEPELGHYFSEDRNENGRSRPLYLHPAPADIAPPARHGDALTAQERHVIEALLDLAYKAWCLADDSEDMGDSHNVEAADFDALSNALDVLQALPDDQPGYTMGEAAKARWALRRLIGTDAAIAVQAKGGA